MAVPAGPGCEVDVDLHVDGDPPIGDLTLFVQLHVATVYPGAGLVRIRRMGAACQRVTLSIPLDGATASVDPSRTRQISEGLAALVRNFATA